MSYPVRMIYKDEATHRKEDAVVYDFHYTQDAEGNIVNTFVTSWLVKSKLWMIAPIWCFVPKDKNTLVEEK